MFYFVSAIYIIFSLAASAKADELYRAAEVECIPELGTFTLRPSEIYNVFPAQEINQEIYKEKRQKYNLLSVNPSNANTYSCKLDSRQIKAIINYYNDPESRGSASCGGTLDEAYITVFVDETKIISDLSFSNWCDEGHISSVDISDSGSFTICYQTPGGRPLYRSDKTFKIYCKSYSSQINSPINNDDIQE